MDIFFGTLCTMRFDYLHGIFMVFLQGFLRDVPNVGVSSQTPHRGSPCSRALRIQFLWTRIRILVHVGLESESNLEVIVRALN